MDHSLHSYTPALRFPDFLNDGEWEVKRLGEIAEFFKGKGIPKTEASNKGKTPCVRYGELYTHYKEIIDETQSFTDIPTDELFLSNANDVIIPSSGETKEDISTASCVIKDNIALGGDINVIRTPHNGVFLSYYLNNTKKDEIAKIAQGVSIIHLYNDQLKNLKIALPSIEEQKKIVDCLTVLDELIAATNGKLEQLKAYKKGLMQKLFPAKGKTVPELRFKEFEKDGEWEEKKVSEIFHITRGYVLPTSETKNVPDGEYRYPVYSSQTANNGLMGFYNKALFKDAITWTTDGANAGTVRFRNGEFYCTNVCGVLISDVGYANPCIAEIIGAVSKKYVSLVGNPKLMNNVMAEIPILVPSLAEQRKIADCLTSIDEVINLYTNKVTLLELYKKGLMQQLFPTSK